MHNECCGARLLLDGSNAAWKSNARSGRQSPLNCREGQRKCAAECVFSVCAVPCKTARRGA